MCILIMDPDSIKKCESTCIMMWSGIRGSAGVVQPVELTASQPRVVTAKPLHSISLWWLVLNTLLGTGLLYNRYRTVPALRIKMSELGYSLTISEICHTSWHCPIYGKRKIENLNLIRSLITTVKWKHWVETILTNKAAERQFAWHYSTSICVFRWSLNYLVVFFLDVSINTGQRLVFEVADCTVHHVWITALVFGLSDVRQQTPGKWYLYHF
jgi:hypothetical protein